MAIALVLLLSIFVVLDAHAQTSVTLKTRAVKVSAGEATITLASGRVITVPAADVDLPAAAAPAGAYDTSGIRPKCAKDFPDDFSTRAYCEKRQHESVAALKARSMTTTDQVTIRRKCAADFPDDFSTRDYCEKHQIEALSKLGR